jgi:hypothetical protein
MVGELEKLQEAVKELVMSSMLPTETKAGQLQLLPITKRKDHTMSPREKLNPNKTQRTSIEDISPLGEELPEERLRLVSGGLTSVGTVKQSHYPSTSREPIKDDVDTTDARYDTLHL